MFSRILDPSHLEDALGLNSIALLADRARRSARSSRAFPTQKSALSRLYSMTLREYEDVPLMGRGRKK